ncbi:MAG: VOC family protein [Thermoplasmata archaeon]
MGWTIDHLGIAVRSLETSARAWAGLDPAAPATPDEVVPSQKVRVRFVRVGEAEIELLEPTDPSSGVARFLESRGEGFHHVAFHVPSVDRELQRLRGAGARTVDDHARPGARGRRVGFAHPSAFGGVLVEFVEGP